MKWLVVVLLSVNVVVWFAGDLWMPDRVNNVATAKALPRVSALKISAGAESGEQSKAAEIKEAESLIQADPVADPVERTCIRLGWFETGGNALDAYRSLGSPGNFIGVREQERALEPLHWIIIPPQPDNQALKLFNELQRRGIDSYLVSEGENRNAISLGLFQSQQAAERVLAAKKRQNLNAVLANFPRNQLSYALVFEVFRSSNANTGNGRIDNYQDDFEMVEISRCEGIATNPENP